ncbi:MAG: hypothetical protein U1F36_15975 [Planctomycetota bacterium]
MKRVDHRRLPGAELLLLVACGLGTLASSVHAQQRPEPVLGRTVRLIQENKQKLEAILAGMSPESAKLDDALRAVDAALARTDLPESERLANAAKAKDEVLSALDAILAHEDETKALFGAQIDALKSAWLEASRSGAGSAVDPIAKENREKRKDLVAHLILADDTPPEWRELFQMAFEMLEIDESGNDELGEQEKAMMQETVAALAQMRREFYASYAEQARAFNSLRALRRSESLQKNLLLSSRDLQSLVEVASAARESTKVITSRSTGSKGTLEEIRKTIERIGRERGKSAAPARTPEQLRRSVEEHAAKYRDRLAKGGK